MSLDEERGGEIASSGEFADTVVRMPVARSPSDIREMMERISSGQPVPKTELMTELERMIRLVARTDSDFESVVLVLQRSSVFPWDPDVLETTSLRDNTALVHTPWPISSVDVLPGEILARPDWIEAHRDPRGVACIRVSLLPLVREARSYADAIRILGKAIVWLPLA